MDGGVTVSRRKVLGSGLALPAIAAAGSAEAAPALSADLRWLGDAPPVAPGAAVWGVPWPRGALKAKAPLTAAGADGQVVPLQTWPLAYWPDGSLKWTGHAVTDAVGKAFQVRPGKPVPPARPVQVRETPDLVEITAGDLVCRLPRSGRALIGQVLVNGRETLRDGRLVCLSRDKPPGEIGTVTTETFDSVVEAVTIEQRGPVRALVRLDGRHRSASGRAWLPFSVRVAVDAAGGLKLTHSFTFDGDAARDFIAGLGVRFDAPLTDELHNRHVRFAGQDDGLWGEAVRNLPGWQPTKFALANRFADQLEGKAVPALAEMDAKTRDQLLTVPAWDGFRLFQGDSDAFTIDKRTGADSSWLRADQGGRAAGLGYVGGVSGGVAFGLRDFWQRHPTGLEITGAAGEAASVTLWLWSPQAQAMDLRHYSDRAHGLEIQYEDVEAGHSTPLGVARTNEILLWPLAATPSRAALTAMAKHAAAPPLPVCAPARYQACGVFGVWSPVDRSTPVKARLEDELDRLSGFYLKEVEQRRWYGFWDHGDVMHTYDQDRHAWRYDVGGYAWANSELVPDLWFWTAWLRSGRADLFRHAEAMTRHTGEVDTYHLGPFKGLGSRHNVSHWGDGAKEARISQALLRRHYYYLTADERTGDIMASMADADHALVAVDPLRKRLEKSAYPTHARSGPDWFAFASNWLVQWERTGDRRWRDKIVKGLDAIAASPQGMFSGPGFGYDPATATMSYIGGDFATSYHLVTIMGGAEFVFELDGLIDDPAWSRAWTRFCAYYNAPQAQRQAALGPKATDRVFGYPVWHARLTAWAARELNDPVLARRAWDEFFTDRRDGGGETRHLPTIRRVAGPAVLDPVDEIARISTNQSSQWSLNLIELLALVGDAVPERLPEGW